MKLSSLGPVAFAPNPLTHLSTTGIGPPSQLLSAWPPGSSEATPHRFDSSVTLIYQSQLGTHQEPGPEILSGQPNPFPYHTCTHKKTLVPASHGCMFLQHPCPAVALAKHSLGTFSDLWALGCSPAPSPHLSCFVLCPLSPWLSLSLSVPSLSLSLLQAGCLQRRLHKSGGADRVWVWGGHSVSLLEPYREN